MQLILYMSATGLFYKDNKNSRDYGNKWGIK